MTSDDRDLLLSLRQQQADLQQTLERLKAQLGALEARARSEPAPDLDLPPLPPLPADADLPPIPPFTAPDVVDFSLPPIPTAAASHALPPVPTSAKAGHSFEYQFGRWLIRIGALFGVIVLALVLASPWVQRHLGHLGLLGLSAAASIVVVILGDRLERKGAASLVFGRTLTVMALAWLYLTTYAAYAYEPLHVVNSPLIGGLLLLLWSIYVLLLAERKKSQTLGVFSITLAYISTALNPLGAFTMGADIVLAGFAFIFLFRNGWATLSTLSLLGTYAALLRRLVIDENGEVVFDSSRSLPFWPYAIYLIIAWFIFTVAIILTSAPTFRGLKRFAFLSLNNGALAGLLALTAYIAGYGASAVGWTLLDTGLVFLVMSRFAGFTEIEPVDLMAAYAAQGLALFTAGLIVVFTGITRGVLLLIETFLLGTAASFSGDRILTVSTYVSAFFATVFLVWEIAVNAHHPWLLGIPGAGIMLINAWACRGEIRHGPLARSTTVISSSCFCIMALALLFSALNSVLSDDTLPPALAVTALILTFSIYQFTLFELPALAQILLVIAQALVLFPEETGETLPWWSNAWVALVTLILITWWARQRHTRSGTWTIWLSFFYALALAGFAHQFVRPYLDAQGWMIGASLLSFTFLVYGAFARVWTLAAVGQIFLALALYHFFFPPQSEVFPWTWEAAAVPLMVVFATATAARVWLRLFTEISLTWRAPFQLLAYGYQLLALVALARLIFGVVPENSLVAAFLCSGTFILSMSVRQESAFGIRCSFLLSSIGMWLYLDSLQTDAHAMATVLNGLAMLLFLCQPALIRHEGKSLVTRLESWTLILFSMGTAWLFISVWVWTRLSPGYLAMGWALYALFLFLFGTLVREARLRWSGMGIIVAAILRVACWDMWGLSNGYRVLTFIVLTLITLGIGYGILSRAKNSGAV